MSYPPFIRSVRRAAPDDRNGVRRSVPEESTYVERKVGVGAKLQNEAVAFSNTDGGVVLIGVDDAGSIVGRSLTSSLEDDIHRRMREINNPGRYGLHELTVGAKSVVVLSVARRAEGFSQTTDGRVLARRGTMSVALIGEDLARFLNERALTRFEETDTGIPFDEVDGESLTALAEAFGWTTELEQRLEEVGFVTGGARTLTVAGGVHLLPDPSSALGKAYVEILRFPEGGTDYDKRTEVRGPVGRQVQRTVDEIVSELGSELVVLGVRRYELPKVPPVVLREAVANAVAHRSYELAGTPIRVELRPSEVRISSPGRLPEPVTVENMRETQASRNARVIKALRQLGLAEDAGRGVDVMVDSMREELLEPPLFEESEHAVTVTLRIRSAITPIERAWIREIERRGQIESGDRFLLVHAARGERLTNSRVREVLGIDAAEARRALQRLRDLGLLSQQGARGGSSYALIGSLLPPAGMRLSSEELADMIVGDARNAETAPLTNARVRALTGLERSEVRALLGRLVDSGRLLRRGQRRGTYYVTPDSQPTDPANEALSTTSGRITRPYSDCL